MWKIFIDISGMPPDDIYVGMFLMNYNYKPGFLTDFYGSFPDLKHYLAKSTYARKARLIEVLEFFDAKRLRMACYHFSASDWVHHAKRINQLKQDADSAYTEKKNIAGFKERIIGILYYYGITHLGIKNSEYEVVCCAESHLDIWQVIKVVNQLAKRDGWKIKIHPDIRQSEEMIKMADYVAGANKKSTVGELAHIGRHTVLNSAISDFDLKKAFRIYPK